MVALKIRSSMESQWVKYRVLLGVAFLNIPGGFSLFYGNLYAYSASYYRFRLSSDRIDLAPSWVLSVCLTILPIGSLMADSMKFRIGLKCSILVGFLLYALGIFLSFISVMNSVWATALTFGVIGMFGLGIVEVLSYYFTSAWFPHMQGLTGSVVGASSSIGAIFFNSIITAYINPTNLKPDHIEEDFSYFTQPEILDSVPMVFVLLGILTGVTQFAGFLMVKLPESYVGEKEKTINKCPEDNIIKSSLMYESSSESSLVCSSTEFLNDKDLHDKKKSSSKRKTYKDIIANKETDVQPTDVLKSVNFYLLWHSLMALSLGMLVVSNYYKFFAQVWITDDTFLTVVGNISAISGTLMRLLMGVCIDRFLMKTVIMGTLSITTITLAFWYFTARLNRWIYLISTNLLVGLTGSVFVLYPLASMKFFGLTYFASNTGLVMLAMTIIELVTAPLVTLILLELGWFWLFFMVSAFMVSAFLATAMFMSREQIDLSLK